MLFLRRANEQRSTLANRDNDESRESTNTDSRVNGVTSWGALADTSRFFESQRGRLDGVVEASQMEELITAQSDEWIKRTRTRLETFKL